MAGPGEGGKLIVGGKLLDELEGSGGFRSWYTEARRSGVAKVIEEPELNPQIRYLERTGRCTSNDTHVIALAMLGGGRILCANDRALRNDFRNIVHGDIYDADAPGDVTRTHRRLLSGLQLIYLLTHFKEALIWRRKCLAVTPEESFALI